MQLNSTHIVGRLTRDPETRQLRGNSVVTSFGLAVNRTFISNGEKKEETLFIDVESFGNQAKGIAQYCSKGLEVLVDGYLKQDQWEDKNGNRRSTIKIVARSVQWSHQGQERGGYDTRADGASDYAQSSPGLTTEPPF